MYYLLLKGWDNHKMTKHAALESGQEFNRNMCWLYISYAGWSNCQQLTYLPSACCCKLDWNARKTRSLFFPLSIKAKIKEGGKKFDFSCYIFQQSKHIVKIQIKDLFNESSKSSIKNKKSHFTRGMKNTSHLDRRMTEMSMSCQPRWLGSALFSVAVKIVTRERLYFPI